MHRIGRYQLIDKLGEGAAGEVWSARHIDFNAKVALKLLTGIDVKDDEYVSGFKKEVQALAQLDHPNIAHIYDFGNVSSSDASRSLGELVAGSPYLVMELAERSLLEFIIEEDVTWDDVYKLLSDMLTALAHAHGCGLIHRDIKPANILLSRYSKNPLWMLADFGLVQSSDFETASEALDVEGTPQYMSPEQFRGDWRVFSPATDLYAIGCVAFQLVSEKLPYSAANWIALANAQINQDVPEIEPTIEVPDGFREWVLRLMQKGPTERFVRAADAKFYLDYIHHQAHGKRTTPPGAPDEKNRTIEYFSPPNPPPARPIATDWSEENKFQVDPELARWSLSLFGLRAIPFVGRNSARDQLWSALVRVHDTNRPRVVFIEAPSGVGKSRLAQWFCERADESGAATYVRAVYPQHGLATNGFSSILAKRLGIQSWDQDRAIERIQENIPWAPDWAVARFVKIASEYQPKGKKTGPVSGITFDRTGALHFFLKVEASRRPLVVWLDDLQWGGEAIELLTSVLERSNEEMPVLFVCTVRTEALIEREDRGAAIHELQGHESAETIQLPPMSSTEMTMLVRELLRLDESLVARIAQRVGGNPLFAIQLVGDWIERKILVFSDGGFRVAEGESPEVPETIRDVWQTRIRAFLDNRPEHHQTALEIAATLGLEVSNQEFSVVLLQMGVEVPFGLVESMVAQRLAEWTDGGWRFIHAMLRESILAMSAEEGRLVDYHRVIAASLSYVQNLHPTIGLTTRIIHHRLAHGDFDGGFGSFSESLAELRATGSHDGVLDLVASFETAAGEWIEMHTEVKVMLALARFQALSGLGRHDDAVRSTEVFKEMTLTRYTPNTAAQILLLQSRAAQTAGEVAGSRKCLQDAMSLAPFVEDQSVLAELETAYADALTYEGEWEKALEYYQSARKYYTDRRDIAGVANCDFGVGYVYQQTGQIAQAESTLRSAHRLAIDAGFQMLAIRIDLTLAEIDRVLGRMDDAFERMTRARQYFETTGKPATEVDINLALFSLERGDMVELQRYIRRLTKSKQRTAAKTFVEYLGRAAIAAARMNWTEFDHFFALIPKRHTALQRDFALGLKHLGDLLVVQGANTKAKAAYGVAIEFWEVLKLYDEADVIRGIADGLEVEN